MATLGLEGGARREAVGGTRSKATKGFRGYRTWNDKIWN